MFECKNCGAHELDNGRCAYCKTVYSTVKQREPTIPEVLPDTKSAGSVAYDMFTALYVIIILILLFLALIP